MSAALAAMADAVLLPGFLGTTPPDWVRERVAGGLGGVVLFARNVADREQLAALTAALRAERERVVVAIDEEGGDVTRLDAATGSPDPGPLALGVVDDVALTRSVAAATARRRAAAGVTLTLAPVADVNSNPDNPVIGVRSFGAEPLLVARHVAAAVAGTQSTGVAACVKHFPGHGDTSVDSHLSTPTVAGDLAEALLPFRAAVDAGVRAVLTGHLRVPGYGELPATVNPALVSGVLRAELGHRGPVVSDALEMGAITGSVGLEEGAVLALLAGVDALCIGGQLADEAVATRIRDAVAAAVRTGRLAEERLAAAAASVATLGDPAPAGVAPAGQSPDAAEAEADRTGLVAARRAIRVCGAARLPAGSAPVLVELDPEPTFPVGRTTWGLRSALSAALPGTTALRVGPGDPVPPLPGGRPLVVVARDAARIGWVGAALAALVTARPDAVVIELGLPGPPPASAGYLATFGASRSSARAAVEALTGVCQGSAG